MSCDDSLYVGVDVGTGSARAGLFSSAGELLAVATKDIEINNPKPNFYEQSSENIWEAVIYVIKEATKTCIKEKINGLSFCATCSMVCISRGGEPVSVSSAGGKWNIMMWMDHRAEEEARFINDKGHSVLDYVGGRISLEMQTPKLLWLKRNLLSCYENTWQFFDLPDYLRFRATGCLKRSMCSVVCKWTHRNSATDGSCWDLSYFQSLGLEDVLPKIGSEFSHPGQSDVISEQVAQTLGVRKDVRVGYSMIDAHSGVLGMVGCKKIYEQGKSTATVDFCKRFALICGTSNCHMALSKVPCSVPGVWGPYYSVILNGLYLNEAGQSAAGKLLDHVVSNHSAYAEMLREFGSHGKVLMELEGLLTRGSVGEDQVARLTQELHIWPDFHGNRSPLADPSIKGMVSGLTLSQSRVSLALHYLATIQALAYGSKMILNTLESNGHSFEEMVICGGLTKSRLFIQTHADVLGIPILVPKCQEPVLLGAAISAAASKKTLNDALDLMAGEARETFYPNKHLQSYHAKKYEVFKEMVKDQMKYRTIMNS